MNIKLPISLADVLEALEAHPDPDMKRQSAKRSAISRVSKFLYRPPSEIPTDIPHLRRLLETLHPVPCGIKPKSLSTLKSDLAAALRATGVLQDRETAQPLTPPWDRFLGSAHSSHQVWGLHRFARYCSARSIQPADVSTEAVEAFHAELDATLLTGDPDKHVKSMIDTWNHVIRKSGLDLPVLKRAPSTRYLARPLSDYPVSLQQEIQDYLDRVSHRDLFCEDGPDKPLRETSLRNIKAHLRQLLDELVSVGHEPSEFTQLTKVITADNLKTAFRKMKARRGGDDIPSGLGNIAGTAIAIARHHLNAPEQEITALKAIHKRVAGPPAGMSRKNRERLSQFNSWDNLEQLMRLPSILMSRAQERPLSRDSALAAMHAAAFVILLSCPMRIKNLAGLDLDRHVLPQRSGTHTLYTIRIEGVEVKNGEPIDVFLNADSSKLLHRYIMQFRSQVSQADGRALFPRMSDGEPRCPSNFGGALTQRVRRETGLSVNPHLFRHIAAKMYLDKCPGNFEVVRRLLKHKRLQTTMDFYAELSNQWAHDHYDKVVLSKWKGKTDV
ncbi:site-specific integrase [Dinoroseobacter sp. PD6]|uniref:site-specific integrase n=1 Tax=Dinoroseobacter sp. PD6 TaxID=3028384 RepID=UPI00237B5971|nr:site-specific integrase [Dinoroseobacter sp. PD6]MDD9718626.1 site-specific integrase [Dinoroseobacter sp. PD6]